MVTPQPEALKQFKRMTHPVFTSYTMSNHGMANLSKEIAEKPKYNPDGVFQIGTNKGNREAYSEMNNAQALSGMEKDSLFSQLIAYGMIVFNFSMWEGEFRQMIADELKVTKEKVGCDVMGDLRLLRNWIVHNGGVANKDAIRLKCFGWYKEGDTIAPTTEEMGKIQKLINTMQVYLK